jgi:acyl-CoA synthetase (AMP-forming)/AMP-acid ligase II
MNDLLTRHNPTSIAILDTDHGVEMTYGQLVTQVTHAADYLRREFNRALVFHIATNTVPSIVLYLACLELGFPVALLDPGCSEGLAPLLRAYEPDVVLLPQQTDLPAGFQQGEALPDAAYRVGLSHTAGSGRPLHPDLALLLTTSGSTGSPKLVRLTLANVLANAHSIVSYLDIQPGERSIQSLPMQYSYGLSLINSHLVAGATVVLTRHSFLRPEFWAAFDHTACTSFAGVPYIYETLYRLRFDPRRHVSLRTMTQAGGALRHDIIQSFYERTRAAGSRFFVMYGQTEATARISYVPCERLGTKIGSVGIAIPHGYLALAPLEDSQLQELLYSGPNVMMGYADSVADLSAGDALGGTLHTGDLARQDGEGFFYLTGRLKRFAKLFGRRINLEDVEHHLETRYPIHAAVLDREGQLLVYAAALEQVDWKDITHYLVQWLSVPPKSVTVVTMAELPLTVSGKKDYKALVS